MLRAHRIARHAWQVEYRPMAVLRRRAVGGPTLRGRQAPPSKPEEGDAKSGSDEEGAEGCGKGSQGRRRRRAAASAEDAPSEAAHGRLELARRVAIFKNGAVAGAQSARGDTRAVAAAPQIADAPQLDAAPPLAGRGRRRRRRGRRRHAARHRRVAPSLSPLGSSSQSAASTVRQLEVHVPAPVRATASSPAPSSSASR